MVKGVVTLKVTTIPTDEPDMAHSHIHLSAKSNKKRVKVPKPIFHCIHELINDHYDALEWMIDHQKEMCETIGYDFKLVQLVGE